MHTLTNVAVLGSTGYVGSELVYLLNKHPNVKINFLGSDSLSDCYFEYNNSEYKNLPYIKNNDLFDPSDAEYVFLALPHSVSNKFVKNFFGKIKIIDLSADFRLDNYELYKSDYGNGHCCSDLMSKFVYGLPEIYRNEISKSDNIAVPGCYPTSILLPLIPLVKNNLINLKNIIIDSKSGYSGAGKKFDMKNIQSNADYNFYNYNTNSHRHINEIKEQLLKNSNNNEIEFVFNPHILPNFRGMMSSIYCNLNDNTGLETIQKIYENYEKDNDFIKIIKNNERIDFFSIQNTNFCKIKIYSNPNQNKIIIVSVIDNLIKGAAGQALQCLNICANYKESISLR